jgi:hypothetical protein
MFSSIQYTCLKSPFLIHTRRCWRSETCDTCSCLSFLSAHVKFIFYWMGSFPYHFHTSQFDRFLYNIRHSLENFSCKGAWGENYMFPYCWRLIFLWHLKTIPRCNVLLTNCLQAGPLYIWCNTSCALLLSDRLDIVIRRSENKNPMVYSETICLVSSGFFVSLDS